MHYLSLDKIDEVKYNECIESAANSRIYAYSWYLDIVADNWDVLVLNDYEALMPLPWRSKFFIKYISTILDTAIGCVFKTINFSRVDEKVYPCNSQ